MGGSSGNRTEYMHNKYQGRVAWADEEWRRQQFEENPLVPRDATDNAIQDLAASNAMKRGGARRKSFLTGDLGEKTTIPTLGKSIITGG